MSVLEQILGPFEPAQICPKCGHERVLTEYRPNTSHFGCYAGERLGTGRAGEHLERSCARCHAKWEQRCVDLPELVDLGEAPAGPLTELEHQALELLAEFSRLLISIVGQGATRGHDFDELYHHVHVLQRTIGSQAAARAYPDRYRLLGMTVPIQVGPGATFES